MSHIGVGRVMHLRKSDFMVYVPKPEAIRARLIVNPAARNGQRMDDLQRAVRILRERGWHVDWVNSQYPRHTRELAREAVALGYNAVIVAGGDGSIGQAADGLAGSDVALGIIPAGTGNILARDLGLPIPVPWYPTAFTDAARMLTNALWHRIDLGVIEDEKGRLFRFINWGGAGLDAKVTLRVEPHPEEKRKWGIAAYVLPAVQEMFSYEAPHWRIHINKEYIEGRYYLVVVNNSQLYAAVVRLAPEARLDDGLLDVSLVPGNNLQDFLTRLSRLALFRRPVGRDIPVRQTGELYIDASPPQPVHLDGDPITHTPVHVYVDPLSLTLMVPSGHQFPAHLFKESAAGRQRNPFSLELPWWR